MPALQVFKDNVLDNETHHLSCAIFHSSVSILLSGLENLIKDRLSLKRGWFSEDVFTCCYVGLITLWEPAIRDSLVLLVDRCVQSSDPKAIIKRVTGSALMDPSSASEEEVYMSAAANTCKGEIGRQISSRHDKEVERGSVIIHEAPFLATVVADCKCREGTSTVQYRLHDL